jgi:hypothetical protein
MYNKKSETNLLGKHCPLGPINCFRDMSTEIAFNFDLTQEFTTRADFTNKIAQHDFDRTRLVNPVWRIG